MKIPIKSNKSSKRLRKHRSPAEEGVAAAQGALAKVLGKADPETAKKRR